MSLFRRCIHDWHVLSKETLPAPYETMWEAVTKAGMTLKSAVTSPSCARVLVQIVHCKRCGALKHFRDMAA